jgi:L-aspartate oxidase
VNTFDLLVIGCGISGLSTAISAAEKGMSVCVFSKESVLTESNTMYAQGGVVYSGPDDSTELLRRDIIKAGDGVNCREAVKMVAEEGPELVREYLIEKAAIPFHRSGAGALDLTREGGHSVRRIIHVQDHTGAAIQKNLLEYASKMDRIELRGNSTAVELITNFHNSTDIQERYRPTRVIGAYVLNNDTGEVLPVFASAVVLATGGLGNLYYHTSNPTIATGDGIAMAYRAGAEIINTEYIQFHPTILFNRDLKRFLITEAMRGEGARLMDKRGRYFMAEYNAEMKDLATRDEVARAIYQEIEHGDAEYVFLDARKLPGISLADRFPVIFETCRRYGMDISREPIPVVPAAHYSCGGIKVDLNGATSVRGLYAVGETACTGVHGANRLASVSLLEGLVYGIKAGRRAADTAESVSDCMRSIPDWIYPDNQQEFDPILIHHDLKHIRTTMWYYAGIIRTRHRLSRAISDLNYMRHRIEQFYRTAAITREIIELRNAIITGQIIVNAAASNPVSRGCHFMAEGTGR